jgi:hypothetical protein
MRVVVIDHNIIKLIPDNDADKALLGMWANMKARLESSSFACDTHATESILIGFHNHNKDAEQ